MLRGFRNFFGAPIRKVKKAAIVAFLVPLLVWADGAFGWNLGKDVVQNVGESVAVLIVSLLPVFAAYAARSDPKDIVNIPNGKRQQ